MIWWSWFLAGLVLMAMEMLTPGGFFLMFFGLAALVVGTLLALGLDLPAWLQWVLFSGLSVASLLLFRGPLLARMKAAEPKQRDVDSLVGESATVLEDLPPGAQGKAELRGSAWTARNAGHSVLVKGQRSRVKRVDGLTIWIAEE
jgi:membrane protein implicated in regulation of membrane protease activity